MRKSVLCGTLAIGVLLMTSAGAHATETLGYAPADGWIKPVPVPATSTSPVGAAIAVLLENMQVRLDDAGISYYNEYAVRIQTAQGMQPSVLWNPETDTVVIHKVQIQRGDQTLDLLAHGQTFTILRREADLDRSMLNGYLTGVLQPEGLQVGDVMSYAYTVTRKDPVLQDKVEGSLDNMFGTVNVDHLVLRAVWPKSRDIRWKATPDLPARLSKTKEGSELLVDMTAVKAPKSAPYAPARFSLSGHVELSQFTSWNEMSRQIAPLYDKAALLSTASPLKAEAEKIRAASPDQKVQAAAVLRLVEEQVRYVFLGMNQGGYVPAGADETWTRRFGDCKGKSALLMALLRELGIKADAMLVNSEGGDGFNDRLPMMGLFDHVIVRAEIAGKIYWLDGTRYGDRDLDSLHVPNLKWGLPLTAAGETLAAIVPPPFEKAEIETFIHLDATAGLDAKAPARIERIYRGDVATQFNIAAQSLTAEDLDKHLRDSWKEDYDWIEPTKVSVSYDPVTGEEKMVLEGMARMEWKMAQYPNGRRYTTDGYDLGWNPDLKRDPGPHARDPVQLSYPAYDITHETIVLPNKGLGFKVVGDPTDKTMAGSAYKRTMSIKDGVFTLDASSRGLQSEITFDDLEQVSADMKTLSESVVYLEAPLNYKATDKDMAAISEGEPKTAEEYAARATKFFQNNQLPAALQDMDTAVKLDPANSAMLTKRGDVKFFLKIWKGPAPILTPRSS